MIKNFITPKAESVYINEVSVNNCKDLDVVVNYMPQYPFISSDPENVPAEGYIYDNIAIALEKSVLSEGRADVSADEKDKAAPKKEELDQSRALPRVEDKKNMKEGKGYEKNGGQLQPDVKKIDDERSAVSDKRSDQDVAAKLEQKEQKDPEQDKSELEEIKEKKRSVQSVIGIESSVVPQQIGNQIQGEEQGRGSGKEEEKEQKQEKFDQDKALPRVEDEKTMREGKSSDVKKVDHEGSVVNDKSSQAVAPELKQKEQNRAQDESKLEEIKEVKSAAIKAGLQDLIENEKYKSSNPNAANATAYLSGGEKQRIGIARAMLRKKAEIFLLDEPTSALDEKKSDECLPNLKSSFEECRSGHPTVIIISHTPELINKHFNFNKAIVFIKNEMYLFQKKNPDLLVLMQEVSQ